MKKIFVLLVALATMFAQDAFAQDKPQLTEEQKAKLRQEALDEYKAKVIADTGASCTEMEGGAIAQAAYVNGVPFVILRAISDKADNSAEMDYPTFETIAAHRCAEITRKFAKSLKNLA